MPVRLGGILKTYLGHEPFYFTIIAYNRVRTRTCGVVIRQTPLPLTEQNVRAQNATLRFSGGQILITRGHLNDFLNQRKVVLIISCCQPSVMPRYHFPGAPTHANKET